ncbi:MAG: T9SS type A sorting domain-containing protein [Bacteroidetes bacterium]|nr:T9SS type A sorting domain-containing protein [Bacteroidota bacterium]
MKKVRTLIFTLAFLSVSFLTFTYESGAGGGYTGAPSENNCTYSGCHTGITLNSGHYANNLTLTGNWSNNGYIPDSSYNLRISMSTPGISTWGFSVTALTSSNVPAGDFTITSSSRTQKRTRSYSSYTRQYVEHKYSGTSSTSTNNTYWDFKWTAPSTNVGDIKFYVALNVANGNGSQSGDTIYTKTFTVIPYNSLPTAEIYTKDTSVCAGSVVSFTGIVANSPIQYEWTFQNGSPSFSSNQNPTINFNTAGKQRVVFRCKNSKGWSGYDTLYMDIRKSPDAIISGASHISFCKGGSQQLIANYDPTATYLWSNGKTGNKITVIDTGTYYVTVSAGTCSKVSNSVVVDYYDIPDLSISSNAISSTICGGDPIRFSTQSGYDSFYWYKNNILVGKTDTNFITTPVDSNENYYVTVRDNNGCISPKSDSISFTIVKKEPAPTVTCQNRTPTSLEFDWTGIQSHNGVQVSTNQGVTWITPSSGSTGNYHAMSGLKPEKDYELWVRGILSAPCFYTEVSKQVCKTGSCSPLQVSVQVDSMVCKGEELEVVVNGLYNQNYSLAFEGGNPFTDTVFTFSPDLSKTYILEVLDSNAIGCPAKEVPFKVRIDEIQMLAFRTQRPNQTFCSTDTIEFKASPGNDLYSFYVNESIRHTSQDSFYYESIFNDGDSAFVTVQKGACRDTSEVIHLNVVPVPDASFSYSSAGSLYTFTPTVGSYKSYFWDFGDGFTSVLKEPDHSFKTSSNKTVTVELDVVDNNECPSTGSDMISLPDFSGIAELSDASVKIYPSPARDQITVEWTETFNQNSVIRILDLNGRTVKEISGNEKVLLLDVSDIPSGLYIFELTSENGQLKKKIFKL